MGWLTGSVNVLHEFGGNEIAHRSDEKGKVALK